jgi:hypothetical protein
MVASPEQEHPRKAFGWAARDASGVLSPFKFSRRYVCYYMFCLLQIAMINFLLINSIKFWFLKNNESTDLIAGEPERRT